MKNSEQPLSNEVLSLIEKSKNTSAGLGGYMVYMVILLIIFIVDTIYYAENVWYSADYSFYSGIFEFPMLFYSTIYLFKGTDGYRIIYGWRRYVLACVFAFWTLVCACVVYTSACQPGEEIHSKTGYTRTELRELKQSYLDAGYSEKDFTKDLIDDVFMGEYIEKIVDFIYLASCCGLWYWTESVKKIESRRKDDENDENQETNTHE